MNYDVQPRIAYCIYCDAEMMARWDYASGAYEDICSSCADDLLIEAGYHLPPLPVPGVELIPFNPDFFS